MTQEHAARQFSFRLPANLIKRLEQCTVGMQDAGLDVTRADVVRLLLKHALDSTHCRLDLLLAGGSKKPRRAR